MGSFRYCTKLGAKWAELVQLMQKFMPRSCVGTIHYEHKRNTPWDPKLMFFVAFRNVWVHLGPICYCTKHDANGPIYWNLCKSLCHEVASELVTTNMPDPHHWTQNSCFSVFRNVWVHSGPFRYYTKLVMVRTGATNAKVHATKSRRNFSLRTLEKHTMGP